MVGATAMIVDCSAQILTSNPRARTYINVHMCHSVVR